MNNPFIAVEGPIGVGKTSLSLQIAQSLNYHLVKEIVDENPFLSKFYDDIEAWSFQTEMFFLCNRYKQQTDLKYELYNGEKPVVADYHIFKNLIFAKRTLEATEYSKYEEIYKILTKDMPFPNIVIYLYASQETLLKRIAMRGREFEKDMDPAYLLQLTTDYEKFIVEFEQEHPEIPVLRINGDEFDFIQNKKDLNIILDELAQTIKKGGY